MKFKTYFSSNSSLKLALEEIKEKIHFKYDFLLIALHSKYNIDKINADIKKVFKTSNYVAFHSITSISDSNLVDGVVVGVFKFEKKAKIDIYYENEINTQTIKKCAKYLNLNTKKTHFIITGISEKLYSFLENLSDKLDYSPINNIIGGVASGERTEDEVYTYQFVDNKIIKNGFVIISFENIESYIDISLGFVPYGVTYKITKAKEDKIYEVDDSRNFAEIFKRLLKGIEEPKDEYLYYTPINILDETDGYVSTLRTVKKLNTDYVQFYGPVKIEQTFKLSFATSSDLIEEDTVIAKRLIKKLNDIEAAFNFSCVARQYILNDKQKEEQNIYVNIFDSHLFGFGTFGEIGPDIRYKKLKLYNETSLVCIMKEKDV